MFRADPRNEPVTLPGSSKEDTTNKVSKAIERLKATVMPFPTTEEKPVASGVMEPVVTFVEPDQTPVAEKIEIEPTPSVSTTSDVTDITKPADGESMTTAPSLFDNDIGMPHTQDADFFGTIGTPLRCYPRSRSDPSPKFCATPFRYGYI